MRLAIALALALLPQIAFASESDARAAKVMSTAFECGTYAELGGDLERQAALFDRGMSAGRQFLGALQAGTITEEERRRHVPLRVRWRAAGPTVDFALGRVCEAAVTSAYDDQVKEDMAGLPLPMEDRVSDDALATSQARLLYQRSACDLL
jgi:hypothetical protein